MEYLFFKKFVDVYLNGDLIYDIGFFGLEFSIYMYVFDVMWFLNEKYFINFYSEIFCMIVF